LAPLQHHVVWFVEVSCSSVRRFAILQNLVIGQDGLVRLASKRWPRDHHWRETSSFQTPP
jgi:hypothetical protein